MAQYRKKPVVIEAWQYPGGDGEETAAYPNWLIEALGRSIMAHDGHLTVKTLEGTMRAEPKDWIIKGVKGELYPCKPDIFDATYEAVWMPKQPLPTNRVYIEDVEKRANVFFNVGAGGFTMTWKQAAEVHAKLGQELASKMWEYGGPAQQDEPPPGGTPVAMQMVA